MGLNNPGAGSKQYYELDGTLSNSGSTASWTFDASSKVPPNAIVEVLLQSGLGSSIGCRKHGSAQSRVLSIAIGMLITMNTNVDSNGYFDVLGDGVHATSAYVLGYWA